MLLYVHVPFCKAKCRYCAFFSQVMTLDALESWGKALAEEAAHFGRVLGRPKVETVYLGGGTPSLIPDWSFRAVMRALDRAFDLSAVREFTLEANPDSAADRDMLALWRASGVNRLSLGAQSFSDAELELLGRPHSAAQIRTAVERARAAGIGNLSLDLIWGLPGQRLKTWLDTLKAAVRLGPEHLSCYGLTLEPGTVLEKASRQADIGLPGEEEQARMFLQGGEYLEEEGFLHYEISNFARMGFSSRHNQGYWEGRDYLGLGPSAVSTVAGRRWENPRSVADYAALAAGRRFGQGAQELTDEVRARERIMLALRTSRGMALADYRALTGGSLLRDQPRLVSALRQKDLIRVANGRLRLTRHGMLVSNVIIARIMFPEREDGTAGR